MKVSKEATYSDRFDCDNIFHYSKSVEMMAVVLVEAMFGGEWLAVSSHPANMGKPVFGVMLRLFLVGRDGRRSGSGGQRIPWSQS